MPAPAGLIQQLDQFLHRRRLLEPRARILAACSGGADSTALVRLLYEVNQSRYWKWKLIIGHVDHGLRGKASAKDRKFVMDLGKQLGLPVRTRKLQLVKKGATKKVSEAAARKARLAALATMAQQAKCTIIALGHHADDQAETILMRLLRGAGARGLSGMALGRKIEKLKLVRPLLQQRRQELRDWLREVGQKWREDKTNQEQKFLRNRVRHELLPLLEKYQPRIREILFRVSENSRAAHCVLNRKAMALLKKSKTRRGRKILLRTGDFTKVPRAAATLALRAAIGEAGGGTDRIHYATLSDAIERIRKGQTHGTLHFSGSTTLRFARGMIYLEPTTK
ncbi:MAG TPA: tRNA lysidine(34) synthetase TilS [Phycisphaerae bacterium]|nr:tRNA lysidine(34) synthetase TilS [Phycisphaerae bacterium]